MKAEIVVGLGFGDEGKGITTDLLASLAIGPSMVVRYCGGHQAGHNVVIGDMSHIHASFGSGTLRGLPSYFSEHCCIYPPNMRVEYDVLLSKSVHPSIYFHPHTIVTTPYDVVYGRIMENRNKHGSCGIGVGNTMKRHHNTPYKLHVADLNSMPAFHSRMEAIARYYKEQSWEFNAKEINTYQSELNVELKFFYDALRVITFRTQPYSFLRAFPNLIFEGAQGILLDMDHGISFPNVTYGNTTSKNAMEICKKIGVDNIDMYYVTRCYLTRHGNGWFPDDPIELVNTEGETNTENEWQGKFRTTYLNYSLLNYALDVDSGYASTKNKNLVITCCDHSPKFQFQKHLVKHHFEHIYTSWSPDSKSFKEL